MWRKPEHRKSAPDAWSSPDPLAQHPGAAVPSHSSSASATVRQHIKIEGEISGQGDFFVDGEFDGKVCISDGTFTVGPNARVTAEVEARQIIVRGEVVGSLKAHERIQILSTAKVTGDMDARGIAIEDGAVLHSKVATPRAAVSQPAAREAPSLEVAESEGYQSAQAARPESPQRAKGAAASGFPSQAGPQER
jgi:cytoskeletal protein CcmA (bactofilin family)